jgi:hypothetical protein
MTQYITISSKSLSGYKISMHALESNIQIVTVTIQTPKDISN